MSSDTLCLILIELSTLAYFWGKGQFGKKIPEIVSKQNAAIILFAIAVAIGARQNHELWIGYQALLALVNVVWLIFVWNVLGLLTWGLIQAIGAVLFIFAPIPGPAEP